jgi:hypothetical protein
MHFAYVSIGFSVNVVRCSDILTFCRLSHELVGAKLGFCLMYVIYIYIYTHVYMCVYSCDKRFSFMHLRLSQNSRIATSSQNNSEPAVPIKGGEFIEKLMNCQLIRNDSTL